MQQQERPPTSTFSWKGFLSFPRRICNPPPSVGKVRSCGVTPFLDVRLDDVLERKHLPPLGLKDFEEYLLYVEQSPENLYFLLWLKEYITRYHAWIQRTKATLGTATSSHTRPLPSSDASLTLFYAKAKQTFFTPGAEYELDVPSDILAPFHHSSQASASVARARGPVWSSQNAHPDPAIFTEVALEVRAMLKESLSRFVRAASTNVGSRRVACGIAGGSLCLCIAGILPLVLTSGHWRGAPHTRLWRLAAFPGIWFALLILFTSFNGICIMVYVFGDLRQLRKFELARPTISSPLPVPVVAALAELTPRSPETSKRPNVVISQHYEKRYDPAHSSTSLPSAAYPLSVQGRSTSPSECSDTEPSESSSFEAPEIEVSPAYFDDVPAPEGPATATALHRSRYRSSQSSIVFPSTLHTQECKNPAASLAQLEHRVSIENAQNGPAIKPHGGEGSCYFGPSAGFIRHEVDLGADHLPLNGHATPQKGQSEQERFDFDLLPRSGKENDIHTDNVRLASDTTGSPINIVVASAGQIPTKTKDVAPHSPLSSTIARRQYKCKRIYAPPLPLVSQTSSVHLPDSVSSPTSNSDHSPLQVVSFMVPSYTAGVPAFKVPMTRVHSPVVIRAQWEVVIRSTVLGLIGAVALVTIFVTVVP